MARQIIPAKEPKKTLNVSWSNSLNRLDTNGKRDRQNPVFVGFFVDTNIDPAFDDAAAAAGWDRALLAHQEKSSEHWLIPLPTDVFILIDGLMGLPEGDTPDRMVLPMAWAGQDVANLGLRALWDGQEKKSTLAVQLVFADLYKHGYCTPVPLSVTKSRTKELATILYAHNKALDIAEVAAAKAGNPREFDYFDIAVRITDGESTRYTSNSGKSSESVPMVYAAPTSTSDLRERTAGWARKYAECDVPPIAHVKQQYWGEIVAWASYRWEAR